MVRTDIVAAVPPSALLEPVTDPYKPVSTTEDLVTQLSDYRAAFDMCQANNAGVRNWRDSVLKSTASAAIK